MRVFAVCIAVASCAACGQSAAPGRPGSSEASSSSQSAESTVVEPAKVMRVRSDLPPGYEVADLVGRSSAIALWGFGGEWTADPAQCGGLADPAGAADHGRVAGFSASGPGGIVYAVVADAATGFDPALVDTCGSWTLTAGRTSGTVTLVGPPPIEGVATLGMTTDATTVVEGGTETHSHADTFIAYLGSHVAFVAVVTDPGSSTAALGPDVAADLLVKTVSAVRG